MLPDESIYKLFCILAANKDRAYMTYITYKENFEEQVKNIKCPVKLISGMTDIVSPIENMIEYKKVL